MRTGLSVISLAYSRPSSSNTVISSLNDIANSSLNKYFIHTQPVVINDECKVSSFTSLKYHQNSLHLLICIFEVLAIIARILGITSVLSKSNVYQLRLAHTRRIGSQYSQSMNHPLNGFQAANQFFFCHWTDSCFQQRAFPIDSEENHGINPELTDSQGTAYLSESSQSPPS